MNDMDDDAEATALAGRMAIDAVAALGDPVRALCAMMTAAASICLVRIAPATSAITAFVAAAEDAGERLEAVLGVAEVRQ